jgi:hypothetical protein
MKNIIISADDIAAGLAFCADGISMSTPGLTALRGRRPLDWLT